ncbi:MAG TPA: hypothetical protein VMS76_09770 [Planctomycetota bacterium]|nr:hypothetical protein [Planctomycetota bacterium]
MAEPLRRRVRARLLRGLSGAASGAPAPLVRAALGGAAGLARFSRYEELALANLEIALGDRTSLDERRRIARGARHHAARLVYEWLRMARASAGERELREVAGWIDRTVELDGSVELLDEAAREGRGLIAATAHIGNWELLAAALRRRGLDGAVVGLRKRNDSSADWLVAMRRACGVRTLAQDAPAREVLEVLRSGATVGLLADLEARRIAGAFVPFFGIPALTLTAPAALARAARLPIVPVRCIARGRGYRLSVETPIELDASLGRREATLEATARLNAVFERWIRETPEQWAWHQPRWRSRPPVEAPAVRSS